MGKFDYVTLYEYMDEFLNEYNVKYVASYTNSLFYDFIKDKSDDFDPYKFKYLIDDIRNYIYKMDYYLINERVNEPKPIQLFGNSEIVNLNHFSHIKFDTVYTLRQRIDYLLTLDICILDKYEYYRLLEFTDIAEELFDRTNRSNKLDAHIENSRSAKVIAADTLLKLNSPLSDDCLKAILEELILKNLIAKTNTVNDDWLYWFGRNEDLLNPHKIHWYHKHSILPNVIKHICGSWTLEAIKNTFITNKFSNPKDSDYINKSLFYRIEYIISQFK